MTPERWQKVNDLFHSALKCDPADRAAFLEKACGDDSALRTEIESLITSHDNSDGLVEAYPFEAAMGLFKEDQADLTVGQRIGQYKILSLLGRGGMGEVYLANDSKLGRRVALKLLPSRFTQDQDRVRRFEQEARAASALNHPNILTIFDIEEIEGTHFIATEYIEGRTLRQRMADGRMELREALDVATQVASALSAAHQAGIAHRDIKPENIMLRPDGYAKVLDLDGTQRVSRCSHTGSERIISSAPGRNRAPRHKAREHHAAPRWICKGPRFWIGKTSREKRGWRYRIARRHGIEDRYRSSDWDNELYVTGTGQGTECRSAVRCLQFRDSLLRNGQRRAGVSVRLGCRHNARNHSRRTARAVQLENEGTVGGGAGAATVFGEGARAALCQWNGVASGAQAGFEYRRLRVDVGRLATMARAMVDRAHSCCAGRGRNTGGESI